MNSQIIKTNSLIRKEMKNKRRDFHTQQSEYANFSEFCQVNVLKSEIWQKSKHVALYKAFNGEVETEMLYKEAYKEDKQVYFPRCTFSEDENQNNYLEFIAIEEDKFDNSFEIASYGILEPKKILQAKELPKDTLVFLPCLAYNKKGYRLGYGGGYYDKFLASHKVKSFLLAFSFQYSEKLIPQVWDIAVDFISNEKEAMQINNKS